MDLSAFPVPCRLFYAVRLRFLQYLYANFYIHRSTSKHLSAISQCHKNRQGTDNHFGIYLVRIVVICQHTIFYNKSTSDPSSPRERQWRGNLRVFGDMAGGTQWNIQLAKDLQQDLYSLRFFCGLCCTSPLHRLRLLICGCQALGKNHSGWSVWRARQVPVAIQTQSRSISQFNKN